MKRINFRVVLLATLALLFIGFPFSIWARQMLTGGIVNHGDYLEVNLKAISNFDLNQNNGQLEDIPARFRALDGKRVELVGEMYSPGSAGDDRLATFQLCYSRAKCCFSGPPLVQHFVNCKAMPTCTAYYDGGTVEIWGTFHVNVIRDAGKIKSIYAIDVDKFDTM